MLFTCLTLHQLGEVGTNSCVVRGMFFFSALFEVSDHGRMLPVCSMLMFGFFNLVGLICIAVRISQKFSKFHSCSLQLAVYCHSNPIITLNITKL